MAPAPRVMVVGLALPIDCFECSVGVYIGGVARPCCAACGSPMPEKYIEFARTLSHSISSPTAA